jgi:predicted permease
MWSDLLYRVRAIFQRKSMERELNEELRFHIDQQILKYTEGGLPRPEAERRAKLEFGSVARVKEESRDGRGISLLETGLRDLQYGVRVLRKSPGFTLVAVLSLALGVGANTAIFQLLDAIRLRSLPVRSPQELAQVRVADVSHARGSLSDENAVTYRIWDQIRQHQSAFSGVLAWYESAFNISPSGEVRMAESLYVSGEYFQVLGIAPARGRLFSPSDDVRGCGLPGAVISYPFWQSEFGGDAAVIGRSLVLNGHSVPVIGVTQPEFSGLNVGRTFEIAVPICSVSTLWFNALDQGTFWWLRVMGRLKPGWSVKRAADELSSLSPTVFDASLPSNYPSASIKDYLSLKLTSVPAAAGISGLRSRYSAPLWMLLAIAGLVLLIACANLANLMLARASARDREIAVRLAIGASRHRLIGQLMVESLLVASAGASVGFLISRMLSRALISLLNTRENSIYLNLQADWHVLAFTAGLAILTCVLFGLTPALRATRSGPGAVLKSASRGLTSGHERFELRRLLLTLQVALSFVLLVGALLFVQSLRNLLKSETGFRQDGIVIADLGFARPNPSEVNVVSFQNALLERIRSIPGVVSAADASWSQLQEMRGTTRFGWRTPIHRNRLLCSSAV